MTTTDEDLINNMDSYLGEAFAAGNDDKTVEIIVSYTKAVARKMAVEMAFVKNVDVNEFALKMLAAQYLEVLKVLVVNVEETS